MLLLCDIMKRYYMGTMIGTRFPDAIVKNIDAHVGAGVYMSRADAVRALVREALDRRKCEGKVSV